MQGGRVGVIGLGWSGPGRAGPLPFSPYPGQTPSHALGKRKRGMVLCFFGCTSVGGCGVCLQMGKQSPGVGSEWVTGAMEGREGG